jgi:hypothetical protein
MPTDDPPDARDDRPRPRSRDADDRDDADDRRGYDRRRYDDDGYEITSNDQMWAIFAHIGVLLLGLFAPLIILFAYGDKSAFVKRHARESLNHQLSLLLYTFALLFVCVAIGFGLYAVTGEPLAGLIPGYVLFLLGSLAMGVGNLILIVLATLAASRYEPYRYRYSIRLLG